MHAPMLQDLLSGVDGLDEPAAVREKLKRLVIRVGAIHGIAPMVRAERIAFARQLLAARISRPTIRDRLMASFGLSRREAYRTISAALNCAV